MTDIHDAETLAACPIVGTHSVSVQSRWNERDMLGFRCSRCGEFSVNSLAQLQLDQYPAGKREQISRVLAAIWKNGDGVAARLDQDGVTRVTEVPFTSTKDEAAEKPHGQWVAKLTEYFRAERSKRS